MPPKTSFTYPLNAEQQQTLVELLRAGNYKTVPVEHTIIAADTGECRVALYKSGKCLVQGKGAADFVTFFLEPCVLLEARLGYEEHLNPQAYEAHIGVDESGKGDYFGPLVVAGAFVDEQLVHTLEEMGVRDSKSITSDTRALALAADIRKVLANRFDVITIGARRYNELYGKMRNVNTLLAWGHARVIENLLERWPDCPRAISDKFGAEALVKKALMQRGRSIELVQRVRAESDMAVAAASILARAQFLMSLRKLTRDLEMPIPKGASSAVRRAAEDLVRSKGPAALADAAKLHFRTTDEVLQGAGFSRKDLPPPLNAPPPPRRPFTRRHTPKPAP